MWLIPREAPLKPISILEKELAHKLSPLRSKQFIHSRGYARNSLADLFQIPPLDIPLKAFPGCPPELSDGWGYISFSHSIDHFLIAWSSVRIGVDLERSDRSFQAYDLAKRHFSRTELSNLCNLNQESLRASVMHHWLTKEAAIKWQKGSLAKDLRNWEFNTKSSLITHKLTNQKLVSQKLHHNKLDIVIVTEAPRKKSQITMLCCE